MLLKFKWTQVEVLFKDQKMSTTQNNCQINTAGHATGGYPLIDITSSGLTHSAEEMIPTFILEYLFHNPHRKYLLQSRNVITSSIHVAYEHANHTSSNAKPVNLSYRDLVLQVQFHNLKSEKLEYSFIQPLSSLSYYSESKALFTGTSIACRGAVNSANLPRSYSYVSHEPPLAYRILAYICRLIQPDAVISDIVS